MYFSTDQQTLNDLNIFGRPGSDSVFSIFDRTQTRGGSLKLAELFHHPMADADKINERCEVLKYLSTTGETFPFQRDLFDVIEQYLENIDERSKLHGTHQATVTGKLKNLVAADPHIRAVQSGVTALRKLFVEIEAFSERLRIRQKEKAPDTYVSAMEPMKKILSDPDIQEMMSTKSGKNLSMSRLAGYDEQLRFRKRDAIRTALHSIYRLDAYLAIARVAKEKGYSYPIAKGAEKQEVVFEEVFHPHVKGAVANSLKIEPGGSIIFLTGANMAGKSTLMKSLGIAMYLAHLGFPVPAKKMTFSVREGIYTSINLPDNLNRGISHFYAEVLRVKKVSRELGRDKNLFIIMDELFRGTNVKDAYEATVAITSAFAERRNCMFIVSTHIMEAGEALKEKCANIRFVYLPTEMEGGKPVYPYKLREGITEDRHGMVIVRNEGILEILEKNRPREEPKEKRHELHH